MSDNNEVMNLLKEMNTEIKDIGHRVIKMETYQKTHYDTLVRHESKLDNAAEEGDLEKIDDKVVTMDTRVRKNETAIARLSVISGLAYTAMAAWAGDIASFFKDL